MVDLTTHCACNHCGALHRLGRVTCRECGHWALVRREDCPCPQCCGERPAEAGYRCPSCRQPPRPKDDWPVNPRQGHIQCACGRIPDRYVRRVCGECEGTGYYSDTPAAPEPCVSCGQNGWTWVQENRSN